MAQKIAGAATTTLILSSFDDERTLFGDTSPEESVRHLQALGVAEIVIKNGAGTCLVSLASSGTDGTEAGEWRITPPLIVRRSGSGHGPQLRDRGTGDPASGRNRERPIGANQTHQ